MRLVTGFSSASFIFFLACSVIFVGQPEPISADSFSCKKSVVLEFDVELDLEELEDEVL